MPIGYHCFVLHAHLPFVRHPEHPEFLEEDWLYEAITETYIPLVMMMESLNADRVPWKLTMSITPPLAEMLADELLQTRYVEHLNKLLQLADDQVRSQTPGTPFYATAVMYRDHYRACRTTFVDRYKRNLLTAFRRQMEAGNLEIITCTATHGFLPLMATENAARAQVSVAVENYKKHFGRPPSGIWLAECGFRRGVDDILAEFGIDYFFLDTHGLLFGRPRPKYGPYRPIYCPSGVAAFARDPESSNQVWSSESGYPGDPAYREFYRDLGYDADLDYIKPFLHSDGKRRNLGFKYYRITGKVGLDQKQPYNPADARERARTHAENFVFNRSHQARYLSDVTGIKPVVVSPYDAELFGHWWFEGPWFLEHCFRAMQRQDIFEPSRPLDIIRSEDAFQVVNPSPSSWGDGGYNNVWLNPGNDWIYRHLHAAEQRMIELAQTHRHATGLTETALNQAARELLLAQSSDWAFIMTTGTMVAYAERRTRDHLHNFNGLYLQITENRLDKDWLGDLRAKNNIFSEINFRAYC